MNRSLSVVASLFLMWGFAHSAMAVNQPAGRPELPRPAPGLQPFSEQIYHPPISVGQQVEDLKKLLTLTPKQQAQVTKILNALVIQLSQIKGSVAIPRAQDYNAAIEEVEAILTPTQVATLIKNPINLYEME